jgi:outer membrane receptor protein involved in Fe transport
VVLSGSTLHLTQAPNSALGFALAFPFSSTSSTISGFETFGDNQFVTAITAFPVLRNQQKYQLRYDVTHTTGRHAPRFGIDFIHEPVLSGVLTANPEVLVTFPNDPMFYAANPAEFAADLQAGLPAAPPQGGDGSFSQNVQRLGMYAEDSWRIVPRLTVNYGLRYDTTFGLFTASGQSQLANPTFGQLRAAGVTLVTGAPHDYRKALAPRIGAAYALGGSSDTVLLGGVGCITTIWHKTDG